MLTSAAPTPMLAASAPPIAISPCVTWYGRESAFDCTRCSRLKNSGDSKLARPTPVETASTWSHIDRATSSPSMRCM